MTRINVVVKDGYLASINELVPALQEQGMSVDQVAEALGVISGSAPDQARSDLLALPFVAAIEESRPIQLPPPDAGVQ